MLAQLGAEPLRVEGGFGLDHDGDLIRHGQRRLKAANLLARNGLAVETDRGECLEGGVHVAWLAIRARD